MSIVIILIIAIYSNLLKMITLKACNYQLCDVILTDSNLYLFSERLITLGVQAKVARGKRF